MSEPEVQPLASIAGARKKGGVLNLVCLHCQGNLTYGGEAGGKSTEFCAHCGCIFRGGKHVIDGRYHRTEAEKAATAESIRRDPLGRELFG